MHPRWEIPGLDFRKDGVWRVRAARVAELRHQMLSQGRLSALNAPLAVGDPVPSSAAVTGTVFVPVLLFSYAGIDSLQFMRDTAQYRTLLFGAVPPGGNPYTLRTFYEQMSNNLFSMGGKIMGWVTLTGTETNYTGTAGTCSGNPFGTANCNGLFSNTAFAAMQSGLREALARVDPSIDFGQFDNDGLDLIPNSGDDDGVVDMIMFAHATRDGACGGESGTNNHIWSHRSTLGAYVTNDPKAGGGFIRINDYFATSALGGATACDNSQIMAIGTAAHEFGHALGLPDLYDTSQLTEGSGEWGVMGSGNYSSPPSPTRMEAWSLNELGWVNLVRADTTGHYRFGAAAVNDTAYIVRVAGTNTRGEYFFLENRQASLADTAMVRKHCQVSVVNSPPCGGGLLIWHADSAQIAGHGFHQGNRINAGAVHGLAVMQADGFGNLDAPTSSRCAFPPVPPSAGCSNRGDGGDVYPGTNNNTAFSYRTNPSARKNLDGSFVGFAIDSIRQVVPGGDMAFRLRFGNLTIVRASDSATVVQVDATSYNVFRDLLEAGTDYTLSVADTTIAANGRTRWRFVSWSDGGARSHTITGSLSGGTFIATLNRDFKLIATAGSGGTVTADTAVDLTGSFIPELRAVTLTAAVTTAPQFCGWSGDVTSSTSPLTLPMNKPYTVAAAFGAAATISSAAARPNGVMGAAYDDTLRINGGSGAMVWSVTGGALPPGVNLSAATGILSGFPRQTGSFSFQATVESCSTVSQTFSFSVTAPTLVTADVVTQLLGPATPLNADQVRYLDYLGNGNNVFDIGDFLAWVKATGAPLSAAVMATMHENGGRP